MAVNNMFDKEDLKIIKALQDDLEDDEEIDLEQDEEEDDNFDDDNE